MLKKRIAWLLVSCLMLAALVLASCGPAETGEEEEATPPAEEEVTPPAEEEEIPPPGEPTYGGIFIQGQTARPLVFDDAISHMYFATTLHLTNEELVTGNWAKGLTGTGEASFLYSKFPAPEHLVGSLAESWEQPEPGTLIFHIRKGVRFHNKPPANGREMTAEDVAFCLNRLWHTATAYQSFTYPWVESITATDKWTVVLKCKPEKTGLVYEAAKRYFAEIMMPFRSNIQKHMERLKSYKIDIIAPSHGPMHNKPDFIMNAYHNWVFDEPRNIVVLPYISMHGSTQKMVEHFVEALMQRGVGVKQFDLTVTDIGKLAMSLVDAATVVVGTPTVLAGPHPNVISAVFLANALRPKIKFVSIIGSYGWGGKTLEVLTSMLPNLKVEILEPILCKGYPREADFKALDKLAESIAQKHKENNFV